MPFDSSPNHFYLGVQPDTDDQQAGRKPLHYDIRDLTTHAIVVGNTGVGKTGLCIDILEEAILKKIPIIAIDLKGDVSNLLLTFPSLSPKDFEPWIHSDDARRAGLNVADYAEDVAQKQRAALAEAGIKPERIQYLKDHAEYSIYTPGADAGLPVDLRSVFKAPQQGIYEAWEFEQHVSLLTMALLALAGHQTQPNIETDAAYLVLNNIIMHAWQRGIDLTLEDIIIQVQRPLFKTIGALVVEDIFNRKKRLELAFALNQLLDAKVFQENPHAVPLDIQSLLYQPDGQPKVSVFYVAHLPDAERYLLIALLMNSIAQWMRKLSGTTSLRAIVCIDEIFGMYPKHPHNPVTKEPLLRLLKTGRAYGVGMLLATQAPSSVHLKGLTSVGTWMVGNLRTEAEKKAVWSALEGYAYDENEKQRIQKLKGMLMGEIPHRNFLLYNVHEPNSPIIFEPRPTMSYLRGPLSRAEIRVLMEKPIQNLQAVRREAADSGRRVSTIPSSSMRSRVFISYAREDSVFALQLVDALRVIGVDAWIDVQNITVGEKWSDAIQHGLDRCDIMLLIISPASMQSRNVSDEWEYYLETDKVIVPIVIAPAKIHFRLKRLQYIDFSQREFNEAFAALAEQLHQIDLHLPDQNS